jgi:succinylglutamic semialdehyde dehydrogenase
MKAPSRNYLGNYLHGSFVRVRASNGEVESRNPGDLDCTALKCAFNFEHVVEAVSSASRGAAAWRKMALSDRLSALANYRASLEKRRETLAELISFETGKPLWESQEEVLETLSILQFYLETAGKSPFGEVSSAPGTKITYHPRGVVAVVAPGICPLSDSHLHFFPALVYGNTVAMKASRHAPMVGQTIAECVHEAGLPAGVFNLIHGDAEVARRLVSHPEVQVVFFTGSYETGLKVRKQIVSDYWKTAVLDMVGKNGILVWNDANYYQALHDAVYSAFLTSGQRRTTASRILVHHEWIERFQNDFHQLAKKITIGYGLSQEAPFLGPLLNDEALENYLRYQAIAVRENCDEIMRGKPLERNPKGHYVSPSIHRVTKLDPKSTYQKSEIFGPNVAFYSVGGIEEAIEVFNLSQHGLVASVYSSSREPFLQVVENVQVGTLHWNRNTHTQTYHLPRGGLKKSGNSRTMGSLAWQQCTYPVVTTEATGIWDPTSLPHARPKGDSH